MNPVDSLLSDATYDNRRRWLTSGAVFVFGALALVVPSGYSLGPAVLLLAGFSLAVWRQGLRLSRDDRLFMLALSAYTAVVAAGVLWHDQDASTLDRSLRFWLALPALFWVMAHPPRLGVVWAGIALGALGAGGMALWQRSQGVVRADGYLHAIQFGNTSLLLGVFCLAGLGWAWQQPHRKAWLVLLGLGAGGGLMASLLSGSRGGWVGLPLVLWVLYRAYGKETSRNVRVLAVVFAALAALAAYGLPQTGVKQRVAEAVDDIGLYYRGEQIATSVGWRFEMWQGAVHLAAAKPLAGWGESDYQAGMSELAEQGVVYPGTQQFDHAHNQFLDTLAKQGVPGLAALLLLFFLPLRLFGAYLRDPDLSIRALGTAGAVLCVAQVDFSLTQAGFNHNSGVMIYAFWLVIWWGTLQGYCRYRRGAMATSISSTQGHAR